MEKAGMAAARQGRGAWWRAALGAQRFEAREGGVRMKSRVELPGEERQATACVCGPAPRRTARTGLEWSVGRARGGPGSPGVPEPTPCPSGRGQHPPRGCLRDSGRHRGRRRSGAAAEPRARPGLGGPVPGTRAREVPAWGRGQRGFQSSPSSPGPAPQPPHFTAELMETSTAAWPARGQATATCRSLGSAVQVPGPATMTRALQAPSPVRLSAALFPAPSFRSCPFSFLLTILTASLNLSTQETSDPKLKKMFGVEGLLGGSVG